MPRAAFAPIIFRELFRSRTLPREPEPDLVMQDEAQVAAYSAAGRVDGVMAASYLFHSAHATLTIRGAGRVVDLGCGPATQLAQIASFNPDTEFVGVDLSPTMLESAEAHVRECGLQNVSFSQGDITNLQQFDDHSVDAVTSTMTLHHLPSLDHLEACFREISRILQPGGAIYLTDFSRLKSVKSVVELAYMNADAQPHVFSLDYERSLRAAFLQEDFAKAAAALRPYSARMYSTWLVPLLVMLRTPPRPLPSIVANKLRTLREALPRRYRRDLDDMRLFFRRGGLSGDPFSPRSA